MQGAILKWHNGSRVCLQQSSLLAVFVAFEVLNGEDKKPGRGKTRQWIRRRDEKGYFNNIAKELAIEDTAEYKEMKEILSPGRTTATHKIVLRCYRLCIHGDHGYVFLIAHALAQQCWKSRATPLQHSEHSREQKKCWTDVEAKSFKLFQHRFNFASTRFNTAERGWQTLSTLPFNKIERMLKQMLKPFARAYIKFSCENSQHQNQ